MIEGIPDSDQVFFWYVIMVTIPREFKKAGEDQEETCLTQIAICLAKIQSRASQTFQLKRLLQHAQLLIFKTRRAAGLFRVIRSKTAGEHKSYLKRASIGKLVRTD